MLNFGNLLSSLYLHERENPFGRSETASLAISVAGAGVVIYQLHRIFFSKAKECWLPYSPASMIESIRQIGGLAKHQFLLDQSRASGRNSYRLSLPLSPKGTYVIGDGALAREILMDSSTDKALAIFRGTEKIFRRPTLISVSTHSPHFKALRKGTSFAFSQREVRRMNQVSQKYAQRMVERIAQRNGAPFDPTPETTRLTFMVICEAALEYADATEEEFQNFSYNNEVVFRELVITQEANPFKKYFGFLFPSIREAYKCRGDMLEFARKVLMAYRQNPNPNGTNTLIKLIEENTFLANDDDQKIAELFLWAFAGFDTTGVTLSTMLILLAMYPRVQEKLRESIKDSKEPHKQVYFQHVVKEAFRYAPVSALGSFRQTGRDHYCEHYKVPKGAVCIVSPYVACHNRSVFSDSGSFRPERWENATPEMQANFLPFAAGSRDCPGQRLAMSEIDLALPLLIQQFSFTVAQKGTLECASVLAHIGYRLVANPVSSMKSDEGS